MDLSERILIEQKLNQKMSLKAIGRDLGRDCKTISNEVKNRRVFRKTGAYGKGFNDCRERFGCPETGICGKPGCKKLCCFCGRCHRDCPVYKKEFCALLAKPPYACNSCGSKPKCTLEKAFYQAKPAQAEYESLRSEAQSGIVLSEAEAKRIDGIISPLVRRGQSIHHVFVNHGDEIMLSEKTVYNYVGKGVFSIGNIDLPRKVRYRPRKSRHDSLKVDNACHIGRSYADFMAFMQDNPDHPVVQMDTVEGNKGGSVLLTVHFTALRFMLAFKRDANTARSVQDVFDSLYERLGREDFLKLFPLLLADRGTEFSNPLSIEFDALGSRRSRVYYCDPCASFQKPEVENNHAFIRRVVPKGISFDPHPQEKIALMMNHVNSYARRSLNDRTPYEAFCFVYGTDILEKLDAELIPPDEVTLHPSLLK